MTAVLRHALARLAAHPGRALLAAGGILAAAAMVGAAITVAYGLGTGFERAAKRAGLADVVARFDRRGLEEVDARVRVLANVRARAYRFEVEGARVVGGGHASYHARLEGVRPGPRGYAVVAGRDLSGRLDEALVERGLAQDWSLVPGDTIEASEAGGAARLRVVGIVVEPETVAFPLINAPRVYVLYDTARVLAGERGLPVNAALLWATDIDRLDLTLAQARAASFGVSGLTFLTRSGIRALIGRAAGLVVALLAAFSLVAIAAAGVMLAASASAEVQRRLPAIGVLRALGAARGDVASAYAVEAALVATPAAALGLTLGWAVVRGPTERLLVAINALEPGSTLLALLAAALLAIVALVACSAAWPAWRAASRSPADAMRGADVATTIGRAPLPGGAAGLGARLALARPLRTAATVCVLAASASVVLLLLSIAALLQRLESEPQAVGKRYQLAVHAPPAAASRVRRVPGVRSAAPRLETSAADSFHLGESFQLVAFEGDHTAYEAPPLAEGRRVGGDREAEVGLGLAEALNLRPGATLAAQLASGAEVRFRVVGVVRALERQGRVAYVRPALLRAAGAWLSSTIAVRVAADASVGAVRDRLQRLGLTPTSAGGVAGEAVQGWAVRNSGFVRVLVVLLASIALLDGLVCLYALAQMLALTAQERRRAIALVRALGASGRQVRALFAGSALVVAALATPLAIVAERAGLGPAVAGLAVAYVTLPLRAGAIPVALVVAGVTVAAVGAAAWVARRAVREPVVAGLREE